MSPKISEVIFKKHNLKVNANFANVIWRIVIRLLFSRGSLSWFVLVLLKEIIHSSEEL